MAITFNARVLIAEDEEFTLHLLRDLLAGAGFEVEAVKSVSEAILLIPTFDPHVIITDLNFGTKGPTGADLLKFVEENHPWVGKIVLTSHSSPALALVAGMEIPHDVTYLVKSELGSISELIEAVERSISHSSAPAVQPIVEHDKIVISKTQGEILLLLAEGYTNAAIARQRGTSLRAAETIVQRTFASLGIKSDEDFNPRILAGRMWQQGKVVIK